MNATIILGIFIALAFALMEFRYFKLKQEIQSKTDSVETSAIHTMLKTVQLAQDGLIHTVQYLEKANQKRMAEMDTIDAYVLKSTKTLESIDVGYKTMKYFWNEMEKREGVTIDVLNNLRSEYNEILVLYREIKKESKTYSEFMTVSTDTHHKLFKLTEELSAGVLNLKDIIDKSPKYNGLPHKG